MRLIFIIIRSASDFYIIALPRAKYKDSLEMSLIGSNQNDMRLIFLQKRNVLLFKGKLL